MNLNQRWLKISVIAVAALAGVAGIWWWHARNGVALSYSTTVVKRGDLVATISATGTIEPVEVVDVGAQVAGRILSLGTDKDGETIDYRSMVEEGAVLAKIDESVYAADLAVANAQLEQDKARELSARANFDQAKAKLVQAEADLNRTTTLNRAKLLADVDYDSAKANYAVAKASVAVAEAGVAQAKASIVQSLAAVEKAQRSLGFCTITSPVNGVIIDRRVNVGQTVVASLNTPSLFLIAKDLTKMQIWVGVNEADVGRIVPGAPVTFMCDAFPGREFQGAVGKVRLNATMTQNVVMYTVEVNTGNSDNLLLPYLTANVRFVLSNASNVLLVPNAALRWTPSSLAQIAPDARQGNPANVPAGDPPGSRKSSGMEEKGPKASASRGTIWIKDGEFARPVQVKIGTSDGALSAVTADELREGQAVITGEIVAAAQTDAKNPFLPKAQQRH